MVSDRSQYAGWNADEAVDHYIKRMNAKIPYFETMEEKDLNYIKVRAQNPVAQTGRGARP